MEQLSIDDRLEYAASNGEMEIYLFLKKAMINRLMKKGLNITKKYATPKMDEFYCKVSWADCELKEEGKIPNRANQLYSMAKSQMEESNN